MAYLLKTDDTISEVHPTTGATFTLEELQAFVGGYIEVVPMHTEGVLICNEEGKLQGLALNRIATERYRWGGYDAICGNVLIAQLDEINSNEDDETDENE